MNKINVTLRDEVETQNSFEVRVSIKKQGGLEVCVSKFIVGLSTFKPLLSELSNAQIVITM